MRAPWRPGDPLVEAHTDYARLKRHALYEAAKRGADADAAAELCWAVVKEELIVGWHRQYADLQRPPIIVAPAVALGATSNALARTFARWLGDQIECPVEIEIIQSNAAVRRDLIPGGYKRLVLEPLYEGPVEEGREYILADDMCSWGGTLASLRGFLIERGGAVVTMTSLATPDGRPRQISLDPATCDEVYNAHNGQLADLVREELGYEASCLTQAEARFLLDRANLDAVRKGLSEARNE